MRFGTDFPVFDSGKNDPGADNIVDGCTEFFNGIQGNLETPLDLSDRVADCEVGAVRPNGCSAADGNNITDTNSPGDADNGLKRASGGNGGSFHGNNKIDILW